MSDELLVKPEDITLDMNQGLATWNIQHTGQVNGLYTGLFTFKVMLSPMQEIEADRDYRELLGKNAEFATNHVEKLCYAISQLKQRVYGAPPFWYDGAGRYPGSAVKDQEVIDLVAQASLAAELKYRDALREKREGLLNKLKKELEVTVKEDKENKDLGE